MAEPKKIVDTNAAVALFVQLVLSSEEWIVRRVESVDCYDDSSLRRRTSVDFRLPSEVVEREGHLLVPLAIVRKEPLANFDITDETGRTLNVLPADENSRIGHEVLKMYADSLGINAAASDTLIRDVCLLPGEEALVAACALTELVPDGARAALAEEFKLFVNLFRRGFLLVVMLRENGEPRRIVKFAYDEVFRLDTIVVPIEGPRRYLGWEGATVNFRIPAAGLCRSYHFEAIAPVGVEITQGMLTNLNLRKDHGGSGLITRFRLGGTPRLHFNTNRATPDNDEAVASVTLRSARLPWLASAFAATAAIAIALTVSLLMLPYLVSRADSSTDAVVSLLVVLPGVVAALITRPPDHAIAARILRGVRSVVLVVGLFAYGAAWAFLALGPVDAEWVWQDLTIATWLGVYVVLVSYAYPRLQMTGEEVLTLDCEAAEATVSEDGVKG